MGDVLILGEVKEGSLDLKSLELLGAGKRLAGELGGEFSLLLMGEAVSGGLYLFTGAIFPLDVLPAWIRPVGFIFPVTYWLEVSRRALLGDQMIGFPTLAGFSNLGLVGILAGFTVALVILSVFFYHWALNRAKEKGLIDMETSY